MHTRAMPHVYPILALLLLAAATPARAQSSTELVQEITRMTIWGEGRDASRTDRQNVKNQEKELYEALVRLRDTDPAAARALALRIAELAVPVEKGCILAGVLAGPEGAAYLEKVRAAGQANAGTLVRCLTEAARRDALAELRDRGEQAAPARQALESGLSRYLIYRPGGVWCYYFEHGFPALPAGRPPEYFRSPSVEVLLRMGATPGGPVGHDWVRSLFGCPDPRYAEALERAVLRGNDDGAAASIHALWTVDARKAAPAVCLFAVNDAASRYPNFGSLAWATYALGRSGSPAAAHALVRVLAVPRAETELSGYAELPRGESLATLTQKSLVALTGHEIPGNSAASREARARAVEQWSAYLQERGIPLMDPAWDATSSIGRALQAAYEAKQVDVLVGSLRAAAGR